MKNTVEAPQASPYWTPAAHSTALPEAGYVVVRIESAEDCDGSRCGQPVFNEDGSLHYVPPHCHVFEGDANHPCCYLVLCDFPA